jgi:hypothetical protein
MLAYDAIVSKYAKENGLDRQSEKAMLAATSHRVIEALVDEFGHAKQKTKPQQKKTRCIKPQAQKFLEESIDQDSKRDWIWSKRGDYRSTPQKQNNTDLNLPIDLESQEQIYGRHRGADTQDSGYINAEVDAYLEEATV